MSRNWTTVKDGEWVYRDDQGYTYASIRKNLPGAAAPYSARIDGDSVGLGYPTLEAAKKAMEGYMSGPVDLQKQLDCADEHAAALKAKNDKLKAEIRTLQLNPPMGSRAPVYNFSTEGLSALFNAIWRTGHRYDDGRPVSSKVADAVNADLSKLGGVRAELLGSATGGTVPPLLSVDDVLEALSINTGNLGTRTLIRKLAGATTFRIRTRGEGSASTKANVIARKLEDRPKLASEVLNLLLAAGVEP